MCSLFSAKYQLLSFLKGFTVHKKRSLYYIHNLLLIMFRCSFHSRYVTQFNFEGIYSEFLFWCETSQQLKQFQTSSLTSRCVARMGRYLILLRLRSSNKSTDDLNPKSSPRTKICMHEQIELIR